ncbi:hypothetical protein [Paraburkholderia sp. BR10882]|uniref:hypothetical protein n=1 Tax=unclassified Paraburkholderia TaxID=2615204 RepID=UPI0034CF6A9B
MSARRKTLTDQYRDVLREVGHDAETYSPSYPPRVVSRDEAYEIVDDVFNRNNLYDRDDLDGARDDLAALLARALSGEGAFLALLNSRISGRNRTVITDAMRKDIKRADRKLKLEGVTTKRERTERLAETFRIPADTIRKITPKLARGRPRKTG